jgi:phasin family protein
MTKPNEQLAAWNQAAYDAALNYARASLASAEQLLKLNLDAARSALEQNSTAARELLSTADPQSLVQTRTKLAETSMQQAASYANGVYEIVSATQAHLAHMFEDQVARFSKDLASNAEQLGKAGPGANVSTAALQSTMAATNAMLENLNKATRQFAELSEATMKAATASMVRGGPDRK